MAEDFSGYKATVKVLLTTCGVISIIGSLVSSFGAVFDAIKCVLHLL